MLRYGGSCARMKAASGARQNCSVETREGSAQLIGRRTRANLRRMLTAIDLFAGAGGATQGFVDAGFTPVCAVDNDEAAAVSYCLNHATPVVVVDDIRRVNAASLRRTLELERGSLALLNACPPCQGWSSLGKRDDADARNDLVNDVGRMIGEFRPKCWLLENVTRLSEDYRLKRVIEKAAQIGYGVGIYRLDAQEFGVPQRRRRLIVIGVRGMSTDSLPKDFASAVPTDFDRSPRSAGEAIARVELVSDSDDPIHRGRRHTKRVVERMAAVPVGGSRFDLPQVYRLDCHLRMASRSAAAAYGRIRANEAAPTMTTRCTTPACGSFIHPTEDRGITLREAALIQTFPEEYAFFGTYGQKEAQIGNAFPPRMAQGIALALKDLLTTEEARDADSQR